MKRYILLFSTLLWPLLASPYMGVGRNLAYKKTFFLNKGGFKGFWHKVGGDDDLFVNQYAKNNNTRVCISPDALILSVPKKKLRSFFYQKVRHLAIGKSYKKKDKFIIGCLLISHILFWAGFILLSAKGIGTPYVMLSLLLRMCILYTTFSLAAKKLGDTFNILPLAPLDFLFTFYYLSVGIVALFTKKIKWN